MVLIIDYKMGNVGSILNMIKKIGGEAEISDDIEKIKNADKLILPGVGAFDTGMKNLEEMNLISVIKEKALNGTPILGICLGMQLLADKSEEGKLDGLELINGEVKKFKFDNDKSLKIPHMGWNTISPVKEDILFNDMPPEMKFYFVHSYYFVCNDKNDELAKTSYGFDFSSMVRKGNIIGAQFHPEKSHKFGMKLLKNFLEI